MNIQLCGPVTGTARKDAVRRFSCAQLSVATRYPDAFVYNPVRMVSSLASHPDAMRECLRTLILLTDMLVTIPGWERSEGACLEVAVARAIGVDVVALEDIEGGA